MPLYRLFDAETNDLGLLRHPAPNLGSGDVLILEDGLEVAVTGRVNAGPNRALTALLEVLVLQVPEGRQPGGEPEAASSEP